MIQQKFKQEVFAKPGLLPREQMLTIQVKNTMLQSAKYDCNTKTPGLHLSATHGKEALGQLEVSSVTREGTAQLEWLVPRPDLEQPAENQPLRRPLKLTPLELPEKVREAQRQKLTFIQQEDKPAFCKLDVTLNENRTQKVRERLIKAAVSPVSMEPLKVQQQNRSSRPQLARCSPIDQNGDKHVENALCQGVPAPLCSKPAPPLLKARVARAGEAACHNSGTLQLDTVRRRPRLRRAQRLEEDQGNSNTSTGGLSADGGKLTQGVQDKGQQAERPRRAQPHARKDIKDPPSWECGSARKSQQEGGSQQSRCTLNSQSAAGANNDIVLAGVKLNSTA